MNPEFDRLIQTETNIRPTDRHADTPTTTDRHMQTYANSYRQTFFEKRIYFDLNAMVYCRLYPQEISRRAYIGPLTIN